MRVMLSNARRGENDDTVDRGNTSVQDCSLPDLLNELENTAISPDFNFSPTLCK